MEHKCNKTEVIDIIKSDIKEIRGDVKVILQSVSTNAAKMSLMGMVSGGIGASIIIILKLIN